MIEIKQEPLDPLFFRSENFLLLYADSFFVHVYPSQSKSAELTEAPKRAHLLDYLIPRLQ